MRVGRRRLRPDKPTTIICNMVSRKVTQFPVHSNFPRSPTTSRDRPLKFTNMNKTNYWLIFSLFSIQLNILTLLHSFSQLNVSWLTCNVSRIQEQTGAVGLQDALEGLPIVITTQPQLFVDVTRLQLGILLHSFHSFLQLRVEVLQTSILKKTNFAYCVEQSIQNLILVVN